MAGVVAVAALAAFVLGAIMIVLVVAAYATRREDRRLTSTEQAPDRLLTGVRRVMGVGSVTGCGARGVDHGAADQAVTPQFGGDDT